MWLEICRYLISSFKAYMYRQTLLMRSLTPITLVCSTQVLHLKAVKSTSVTDGQSLVITPTRQPKVLWAKEPKECPKGKYRERNGHS